jgi:hypothetical protein
VTPKVGWYTTLCCAEDLRRIDDESDLASLLDTADEDGRRFWATEEEARAELWPATLT